MSGRQGGCFQGIAVGLTMPTARRREARADPFRVRQLGEQDAAGTDGPMLIVIHGCKARNEPAGPPECEWAARKLGGAELRRDRLVRASEGQIRQQGLECGWLDLKEGHVQESGALSRLRHDSDDPDFLRRQTDRVKQAVRKRLRQAVGIVEDGRPAPKTRLSPPSGFRAAANGLAA